MRGFASGISSSRMARAVLRWLVFVVAALLAAGVWGLESQAGERAAASVLDRTFVCSTVLVGGVHQATASAHAGTGRHGKSWDRPAFASVSTSAAGSAELAIYDQIAWVTTGRPSSTAKVVDTVAPGFDFPVTRWGTVAVNRKQCQASKASVPVSTRGLVARDVGVFVSPYDCPSARILVRVRATFSAGASLTGYQGFLRTTAPASEASLMVRSTAGKPLAHMRVLASGKATLHTAPTCVED